MTRRSGQVTAAQAFSGLAIVIAVSWGLVTAVERLIPPAARVPTTEAPAEAQPALDCPDEVDAAAEVTAERLIECPRAYDGATVTYRGEVVRAVLRRGDRAWVQVNDDRYALDLGPLPEHRTAVGGNAGIAVSIPAGLAQQIDVVGDARHHGAVIEIEGRFRRADPADAGGPAIRARRGRIVRSGRAVERPATTSRMITAGTLALVVAAIALVHRRGWPVPRAGR